MKWLRAVPGPVWGIIVAGLALAAFGTQDCWTC